MFITYTLLEINKTLIFEIKTHKVKIMVPESLTPSMYPYLSVKLYSKNKKLNMHKINPCQSPSTNYYQNIF